MKLKIADMNIELMLGDMTHNSYRKLEDFCSEFEDRTDLIVTVEACEGIERPDGKILLKDIITWQQTGDNHKFFSAYEFSKRMPDSELIYRIDIDGSWDNAKILYLRDNFHVEGDVIDAIGSVLFKNKIIQMNGLVLHASAVEHEGKALLFSAPSGMGKSTHAGLWEKFKEARIINDDRPAIRIMDSKPVVFGTPWSGSVDKFTNRKAGLKSIVILEQAAENRIAEIEKADALKRIAQRCFLPYQDYELMNLALSTLKKIVEKTPIYLLKCRPDKEAVELVYKCVK